MQTEILTIREIASYLKLTEKTVYRYAAEGVLPAFKVGSAWRFRKEEVDRWIKQQEQDNQKSDGGRL